MKSSFLLITLAFLFGIASPGPILAEEGGSSNMRRLISLRFPGTEWVSTERLAQWMDAREGDRPALLDARSQSEFDVSHLIGAVRVDPDASGLDPQALALSRDSVIVVYCSVGYRSAAVARRLTKAGFERVYNLQGGIFEWANQGRSVYREGERVESVHPYNRTWGRLLDARFHPE